MYNLLIGGFNTLILFIGTIAGAGDGLGGVLEGGLRGLGLDFGLVDRNPC